VAISSISDTTPGRMIRTSFEDRCSTAKRNSTLGTSRSTARSTRNSRNAFQPARSLSSAVRQLAELQGHFLLDGRITRIWSLPVPQPRLKLSHLLRQPSILRPQLLNHPTRAPTSASNSSRDSPPTSDTHQQDHIQRPQSRTDTHQTSGWDLTSYRDR
jgi:hypothetical protein